jgi:hypothetical protein
VPGQAHGCRIKQEAQEHQSMEGIGMISPSACVNRLGSLLIPAPVSRRSACDMAKSGYAIAECLLAVVLQKVGALFSMDSA